LPFSALVLPRQWQFISILADGGFVMEIGKHWETIRTIFEEAYKSCSHFAIATVNEDGSPHVTPIGALILRDN
jgi:predicted pyridoxine 5'-phosphate oxidase superfamily flavin-nucleotide-binding protein